MRPLSYPFYLCLLTGTVLCAFVLRLVVIERFVGLNAPPSATDGLDQLDYDQLAWHLSIGQGYTLDDGTPTARRTPGTAFLLLPAYALFGHSYAAGRCLMALLSAITCGLVAAILVRPFGRWTALTGAVMLAFNPGSFYYTLHLWSEPGYAFAVVLATALSRAAWDRQTPTAAAAAGLCWGCSLLIRPQVLFVMPFALLALLWPAAPSRRKLGIWLGTQCLVAGLVVAPWVVRNAMVIGKPCLATVVGGMTFWGAHNEVTFSDQNWRGRWIIPLHLVDESLRSAPDEVTKERVAWEKGWDALRRHASQVPVLSAYKLYRLLTPFEATPNTAVYWSFAIAWIGTAPFIIIGYCRIRRTDSVLANLVLAQLGGLVVCTLLFYGEARFRHSLEPLLMVLAAPGLTAIISQLQEALTSLQDGGLLRSGSAASPRLSTQTGSLHRRIEQTASTRMEVFDREDERSPFLAARTGPQHFDGLSQRSAARHP